MNIRLKELCQQRGISQKELSQKLNVTEMTLSRVIKGNTSLPLLEKIATALEIEVWQLFTPSTNNSEFMALVKNGNNFFSAMSLSELENIVAELKKAD